MKISVLGSGSFASAIAQILTDNGNEVLLYTNDKEQVSEINHLKTNVRYYKDFNFSENVSATSELEDVIKFSDIIVIALPSHVIESVLKKLNKLLTNKKIFINMSKGLDYKNFRTISEVILDNIKEKYIDNIYSLTGPSFAIEIIERKITSLMLASKNISNSSFIIHLFKNDYIYINTTVDIIGIEVLSALKNVIALCSGLLYGLGYKENTHAALITKGLEEMMLISPFYDIDIDTVYGLSGLGDLVLTAGSKNSRNFITGYKVGSGIDVDEAIKSTITIVEGVECCKVLKKFSKEHKINLPIVGAVYNIFYKNKKPEKEIMKIFK